MTLRSSFFFLLPLMLYASPLQSQVHGWSQAFGGRGFEKSMEVAIDGSGNVIVTGSFVDTLDFGGGELTGNGSRDIFLAKLGPSGGHLWSKSFGDPAWDEALSVAVDTASNIIITGQFEGVVDFGGGELTGIGNDDIFLVKFDAAGNHLWSKRFGDDGFQGARRVTTDSSGNVIITGQFLGTVDFGGGPLTVTTADDAFLAKFDPAGNHLWSRQFGETIGSHVQVGYGVSVDLSDNVILAGSMTGTVDFGGGAVTSDGDEDIFIAKFDVNGNHLWSQRFGDSDRQRATSSATDASGSTVVTGELDGTVDFGGGPLTSTGTGRDVFLVKFDPDGNHAWSRRFGNEYEQRATCVAVDASGKSVITGRFTVEVDFGGGMLNNAGTWDIFLAQFDPSGGHLWSQRYGDADHQNGRGVAISSSDKIAITGRFQGTVDFGGGALTSAGDNDVYVAQFDPNEVPTLLQSFSARYTESGIEIMWRLSEVETGAEFAVLRAVAASADYRELRNPDIRKEGLSFRFVDTDYSPGLTYRYLVEVSDSDGRRILFETEEIRTPKLSLSLSQNYPNPFYPTTTIAYSIAEESDVELLIYDVRGALVRTLVNEPLVSNDYRTTWDGKNNAGASVATGVYFYRLRAGTFTSTKKLVLLR